MCNKATCSILDIPVYAYTLFQVPRKVLTRSKSGVTQNLQGLSISLSPIDKGVYSIIKAWPHQ